MRRSRVIAASLLCILLAGCTAGKPRSAATYVVQRGDTLYSIAWRHNLDYREVARWNNLRADFRLSVGQVLLLTPPQHAAAPSARPAAKTAPASPAPKSRARANAKSGAAPGTEAPGADAKDVAPGNTASGAARAAAPTIAAPKPPILPAGADSWAWPTDRQGPPRPVPGGGILLFGTLGQDVRATANGRVVYTGNGLRGYGNLVIVKHGESLLSSYAHNQEMLVHEGQEVRAGQVIAHMGEGPHQIAALYFEIRVNGKPVDPATYLHDIK